MSIKRRKIDSNFSSGQIRDILTQIRVIIRLDKEILDIIEGLIRMSLM